VPERSTVCFADRENNIWITGNGDGIIQKWTHDGKLLMQIGKRGVFDSSDGTSKGKNLNASPTQFFNPAGIVVDPANGDVLRRRRIRQPPRGGIRSPGKIPAAVGASGNEGRKLMPAPAGRSHRLCIALRWATTV